MAGPVNGGSRTGVLEENLEFLRGDVDERVIHDIMNDVLLPQGKYPEIVNLNGNCVKKVKMGGTWWTLRVPEQ